MEIIGPVIEILKPVGLSIRKFLRYHRKLQDYVNSLKNIQEELESRKEDIERRLHDQLSSGRMAKKEVENWLKNVHEIISSARSVEEKSRTAKYLSRARIGKLVDKMIQEMKEVFERGNFPHSLVVNDPLNRGIKLPTSQFVGQDDVKERILACLLGDRVRKIAVCGMGGVGKTTIMRHVYNELLNTGNSDFGKVIWVTVSKKLDINKLQDDIAQQLRQDLSTENTVVRSGELLAMLEKLGNFVLILDDVWQNFLLEDVGIPEPTASNNCKLILTSRSMEVARLMDCKVIAVKPFSEEIALDLFIMKAGLDRFLPSTLEQVVRLTAKECAGLPLAISMVAGSMKRISDPRLWMNALNELRERRRFAEGDENEVFEQLKFSYDRLKNASIRYCFLYCSLYPEDYDIPKEEIIKYWIEEGFIDEMETREAMVYRGHDILRRLEENSLLEKGYDENHVKMHDLVRDMALQITHSKPRFLVKAGMYLTELPDEQEWTEDLEKVSLMRTFYLDFSEGIPSRKCQMLTTLLLCHNNISMIPESFFQKMPNLKILDLSWNPIVSLPSSVSNLENLTALFLGGCRSLEKLPCLSNLKALKHFDLNRTLIKEIPQGVEMLVKLKYLDLRYTKRLREIPKGILPKLSRLQHLYVHNIISKEIAELRKLQFFVGKFGELDDFITFVESLSGRKDWSTKYKITVGSEPYGRYVEVEADWFIKLINLNISQCHIKLPPNIQVLEIFSCDGIRSLDVSFHMKTATDLRRCTIDDSQGMLWVLSTWCLQLSYLEYIRLSHLPDLNGLLEPGPMTVPTSPIGIFSSLKEIGIYECEKIKKLFLANWVLHGLQNLEEIIIYNCEKMEEIIESDCETGEGTIINVIKFTLPKFRKLVLQDLPVLRSICGRNGVIVCDSLQEIYVKNCPKLKRIPLFLPLLDKGQRTPAHSLQKIFVHSEEWWESTQWDHLDTKDALQPFVEYLNCAA